jgi:hypothetical protein
MEAGVERQATELEPEPCRLITAVVGERRGHGRVSVDAVFGVQHRLGVAA